MVKHTAALCTVLREARTCGPERGVCLCVSVCLCERETASPLYSTLLYSTPTRPSTTTALYPTPHPYSALLLLHSTLLRPYSTLPYSTATAL